MKKQLILFFLSLGVILLVSMETAAQGAADISARKEVQEANPGRQQYFGSSGDIDGNLAVITATQSDNPNAWNGGIAYVYQFSKGEWKLRNSLYPKVSAGQDRFGQNACDLQGNLVIVGDWMNNQFPGGAAHIFELSGDTGWSHITTIAPNDKDKYDHFGNRVAIYKNTAAVSTYSEVFIYELENGKWIKKQVLTGANQESNGFGQSIALHKNQLIIGSIWEDTWKGDNKKENTGAVYVYIKKNGKWILQQKLTALEKDVKKELEFGYSLAISDDLLAVGVPKKNMGNAIGAGAVYLYRKQNEEWAYDQLLYNERFRYGIYRFGHVVSISGDFLAVTEGQDKEWNPSVFVYQFVNEKPKLIRKIQEPDAVESNRFAKELMAISANQVVAGDGGDGFCDDFSGRCGKAYFYSISLYEPKKPTNTEAYALEYGFSDAEIRLLKQKFNGDRIVFDHINGDLVYKMRDKETQLWGMYQGDKVLIPAEYDSIKFYGWNHPYTVVGKNGLLGIYASAFSDGKQTVDCKYQDFHTYTYEGQLWLAGKREGKWRWVNWHYGYETSQEFDYHQELYILKNWKPGR